MGKRSAMGPGIHSW